MAKSAVSSKPKKPRYPKIDEDTNKKLEGEWSTVDRWGLPIPFVAALAIGALYLIDGDGSVDKQEAEVLLILAIVVLLAYRYAKDVRSSYKHRADGLPAVPVVDRTAVDPNVHAVGDVVAVVSSGTSPVGSGSTSRARPHAPCNRCRPSCYGVALATLRPAATSNASRPPPAGASTYATDCGQPRRRESHERNGRDRAPPNDSRRRACASQRACTSSCCLPTLAELSVRLADAAEVAPVLSHFHYLRSFRQDSISVGAFYKGRLAAVCSRFATRSPVSHRAATNRE